MRNHASCHAAGMPTADSDSGAAVQLFSAVVGNDTMLDMDLSKAPLPTTEMLACKLLEAKSPDEGPPYAGVTGCPVHP